MKRNYYTTEEKIKFYEEKIRTLRAMKSQELTLEERIERIEQYLFYKNKKPRK